MRCLLALVQLLAGCSTLNSYILERPYQAGNLNKVPYYHHFKSQLGKRLPEVSPARLPEYPNLAKRSPITPNQAKRSPTFADAKPVVECMTVSIAEEGRWRYESTGNTETCGIYIVTRATSRVEVTFEHVDIDCQDGLVMFFDGWELNGHVIPPVEDHPLSIAQRSGNVCSDKISKKTFISNQNAALVSFKVPTPGQGFVVSIKIIEHPNPCNILMSDLSGVFTLTNNGEARNCSLTTMLFPANFEVLELDIGPSLKKRVSSYINLPSSNEEYIGKKKRSALSSFQVDRQCSMFGSSDFVELGGSPDLDSSQLETKETLCGFHPQPSQKGLTILCGSSTVRLVSSGSYFNSLTVAVKAASEEDLNFEENFIMSCSSFA